jgi:hypothetical protein
MINLTTIFRAGFVRRWHVNPDLSHTVDRLDGHHGRTARLMLALWPDTSAAALRYALTHDDGESKVGDVPATHKGAHVTCDAEDRARFCIWGPDPDLTATDRRRVKLCDRLDAYMWAKHHAPHVMNGDGWPEARRWIMREAEKLGVYADVLRAI